VNFDLLILRVLHQEVIYYDIT